MTTVGVVGLGKLGLMLAMVLDKHGKYDVVGYDPTTNPNGILSGRVPPPQEEGIAGLIEDSKIQLAPVPSAVVRATDDVIFVVVQTPHLPDYDGTTPLTGPPADFEYGFLVQAVRDISKAAREQGKPVTIVIVSTVLPGTINRLIRPLLNDMTTRLVYSPSLIALGQVRADLLDPEFVIIGTDDHADARSVMEIYATLHDRPFQIMSIESAELTKMAYNTFTSLKIVFANTIMELAHKTGADCDAVTDALSLATRNLLSPAYLRGGMGGGGYCHPRDVVAMWHLSSQLNLSGDLFGFLHGAREDQSSWLADVTEHWAMLTGLPIAIFGTSYRPESSLTGGSASLLLHNQLIERGLDVQSWDPIADGGRSIKVSSNTVANVPRVYVIATNHRDFRTVAFAPGSVVIDPHGNIPDAPGVTVVKIGRK